MLVRPAKIDRLIMRGPALLPNGAGGFGGLGGGGGRGGGATAAVMEILLIRLFAKSDTRRYLLDG